MDTIKKYLGSKNQQHLVTFWTWKSRERESLSMIISFLTTSEVHWEKISFFFPKNHNSLYSYQLFSQILIYCNHHFLSMFVQFPVSHNELISFSSLLNHYVSRISTQEFPPLGLFTQHLLLLNCPLLWL